ncbi:MAG: potassium transporter Kup [Thermoanaerobaculia bacterium]
MPSGGRLAVLSLGALGIVYGDIGTSPLYALRECFTGHSPLPPTPANILGILSLVFWSLIIVISIKYLVFVMRADHAGEGGILALMSLAAGPAKRRRVRAAEPVLVAMGLFGAALLYGDGMITPAISVLSAIEGLEIGHPGLAHFVVPITIVVLILFFMVQQRGTGGIGAVFGPIMLIWFCTIGILGARGILKNPRVLESLNPMHAFRFMSDNGWRGFLTLGAVFLVVTGGEALYADMGHFGVRPIRICWFVAVLPALLLNYLGQGALLMVHPESTANPFYLLAPAWSLTPLIALSTIATVIASQAVVSGAFSLTRQAVQLGYLPRVHIEHTSTTELGQIYLPTVNKVLMFATIALVLGFRTSSNLAAAYGIAVTATMVITTVLLYFVARRCWHWRRLPTLALTVPFVIIDLGFFGANAVKIPHGGWFALAVALLVFTLMTTWHRGRKLLNLRVGRATPPIGRFLADVKARPPHRVAGTAVFLTRLPSVTPVALIRNLEHNKVLHESVILLTIDTEEVPRVDEKHRATVEPVGPGIQRVIARYGFMEEPNVPALLRDLETSGQLQPASDAISYFLSQETVLPTRLPGMALWRERLFARMQRNARSATLFFQLPPNRVVEFGTQIEM